MVDGLAHGGVKNFVMFSHSRIRPEEDINRDWGGRWHGNKSEEMHALVDKKDDGF